MVYNRELQLNEKINLHMTQNKLFYNYETKSFYLYNNRTKYNKIKTTFLDLAHQNESPSQAIKTIIQEVPQASLG